MKVILVLLDGLNYDVSQSCMGFLSALCHDEQGSVKKLQSELPSLSRPLYETILTGVPPIHSGIYSNDVSRLSHQQSIFHQLKSRHKITAAAAYHWVSELYNRSPFNPYQDRYVADENLTIPYGHFYFEDHYPDSHLFLDGEMLRQRHQPDFLFIHSMNIDDAGHKFGLDSSQYRNSVRKADMLLSRLIPTWLEEEYIVIITSDHGMNNDKSHGGTLSEEREVPLYVFGDNHAALLAQINHQTDIAPVISLLI